MAVDYYGFGPEFQGAQIAVDGASGEVLTVGPGVGPFPIDDDVAASGVLTLLDTPQAPDPLLPWPRAAGGVVEGTTMNQVRADSKRLGRYTLPTGTVSKVRVYADGNGNGPGDPVARVGLYDSTGVEVAETLPRTFGRNMLTATPGSNTTGNTVSTSAGVTAVTCDGSLTNQGAFYLGLAAYNSFPGETVTMSAMLKGDVGGEELFFQLRGGSTSHAFILSSNSAPFTLTSEWARYTWTTTIPTSPDGAVFNGFKALTTTAAAVGFQSKEHIMHRGDIPQDYSADRLAAGWQEFTFPTPVSVTAGEYFLSIHTGSDLGRGTTSTANTLWYVQSNANVTGWTPTGTGTAITLDAAQVRSGGASALLTLTNNSTIDAAIAPQTATTDAGDLVTTISYVRPSVTMNVAPGLYGPVSGYNSAGTSISCPANVWTRLVGTFTTDRAGYVRPYFRVAAGLTATLNIDDLTVQVQHRNTSRLTSLRVAGVSPSTQDVNYAKSSKASVDGSDFSAYNGGTVGASIGMARVTTDAALPYGTQSCVEYTGTAGSTTTTPYMIGPNLAEAGTAMGAPTGSTYQVSMAFKLVSGTITNFKPGVRTVDGANTIFGFTALNTLTAPTAGRWYFATGTVTVPAGSEYHVLQPSVTMDVPAGNSYVARLGHVQISKTNQGYIDGDLPACEWSATTGYSAASGPMGRVNWIRDPRTVTSGQWSAAQSTMQLVSDPTSPTGNAIRVHSNTGIDAFASSSVVGDTQVQRVPALPGEQWTLSGWMKPNAAAIAAYVPFGNGAYYKNGPSLWTRSDATYSTASLPAAQTPTVPDVWVPFSITSTIPIHSSAVFFRLYNSGVAVSGPETLYAGLKLERGTWPAGDYFTGNGAGRDWYGIPDQSNAILWQEPDLYDIYLGGADPLPTMTPALPAYGSTPAIQVNYT